MKLDPDDLAERKAVWISMSALFLDTDVSLSYEYVARECAASNYSLKELEQILNHEVAPVCSTNLLSVAGEWAGFDEHWLIEEISRNCEKHHIRGWFSNILLNLNFRGYIQGHWQKILPLIISKRIDKD